MTTAFAAEWVNGGIVISTGNTEIDKKMGGDIPSNSMTLIEGQSDAGKSVLAQQMIWGSLNADRKTVLYTTENTVKSFVKQMASLSLDISRHLLRRRLKVYPVPVCSRDHERAASRDDWTTAEIFRTIIEDIGNDEDPGLVVIDSLTGFVTHTTEDETIGFFEACKELCDSGKTIINVAHSYAFADSTLIRISSMCDAHLRLKIEEVGNKLIKSLEVAKVRGADKNTGNVISFDVEPGMGMRIIPISKAQV